MEPAAAFTIVYNITGPAKPLPCSTFDPRTRQWAEEPAGQRFDANGTEVPGSAAVEQLQTQICAQPLAAGPQMAQAVLAGGQQAQDWAQALLSVFCVDPVGVALQAAFDYLKQGSGGLAAVQNFFSQLVAAADARETTVPTQAPSPEGIQLFAALNTNETTATCPQFDPASLRWNVSALAYEFAGSAASPDASTSGQLASRMCSEPSAAATQLVQAVTAGGDQAQAAAAAVKQVLQSGSCSVEPALLAALDLVNPHFDQGSLDATRS
ncbi:hypothetical protein ABPG77_000683 [Micractinium sp. CCAP 211/92]